MIDVTPQPKPKRGKGLLRVIGLLLAGVMLAGAGFGAGWFYFSRVQSPVTEALRLIDRSEAASAEEPQPGTPQKVARPAPETQAFVTTYYAFAEPLTTNLAGSRRFLQIGISLSTQYDATVMTHVETHKAAIRSDMLAVVSGFSEEQITGREGREALANALKESINQRLVALEGFGGVEGVFFTSFVLQ
ncbi:flagellar basal body-associated FliL family protein [Pseudotabrizicola algicola]|uniref:Flagellar protein FliL n=1 Tax=Pseudotabrizicola algicola TaxID=2709381 RepID=A0A6B3RJH9_9RHOB|nr:flagellar basal body-associated FliL family protein [Pseudotabrizicola algicola]NEX45283.1 flagellar basal body protein FliL [Pseudotabrizicola algicola]